MLANAAYRSGSLLVFVCSELVVSMSTHLQIRRKWFPAESTFQGESAAKWAPLRRQWRRQRRSVWSTGFFSSSFSRYHTNWCWFARLYTDCYVTWFPFPLKKNWISAGDTRFLVKWAFVAKICENSRHNTIDVRVWLAFVEYKSILKGNWKISAACAATVLLPCTQRVTNWQHNGQ